MHFNASTDYPASAAAVAELFANPDFVDAKIAASGASEGKKGITGSPAGAFSVATTRTMPSDIIPAQYRKFVPGGVTLTLTEAWGAPSYTFSAYHRRNGILFAAGPDFPPNPARGEYDILDVAPTIYWLFDVDLPRDLDGHVPPGLVGEAALAARPPRVGERTVVMNPADAGRDDASREAIEALPYVR